MAAPYTDEQFEEQLEKFENARGHYRDEEMHELLTIIWEQAKYGSPT